MVNLWLTVLLPDAVVRSNPTLRLETGTPTDEASGTLGRGNQDEQGFRIFCPFGQRRKRYREGRNRAGDHAVRHGGSRRVFHFLMITSHNNFAWVSTQWAKWARTLFSVGVAATLGAFGGQWLYKVLISSPNLIGDWTWGADLTTTTLAF